MFDFRNLLALDAFQRNSASTENARLSEAKKAAIEVSGTLRGLQKEAGIHFRFSTQVFGDSVRFLTTLNRGDSRHRRMLAPVCFTVGYEQDGAYLAEPKADRVITPGQKPQIFFHEMYSSNPYNPEDPKSLAAFGDKVRHYAAQGHSESLRPQFHKPLRELTPVTT